MTHLLDTSAMLAHYLAEPGGARVQTLFEDPAVVAGSSILAFFEFEPRLHQLGIDAATASTRGAILVHRDPHLTAIPAAMLKQEMLPPK